MAVPDKKNDDIETWKNGMDFRIGNITLLSSVYFEQNWQKPLPLKKEPKIL